MGEKLKKEAKIFQPSCQSCIEISDVSCVLSQLDIDIFAQRPKLPKSCRPQPVIAKGNSGKIQMYFSVIVCGEFI